MPANIPSRSHDYPAELASAEQAAIAERRAANKLDPRAPQVGFALSGGGIRSATFCLGLFQALARQNMIRRIDYLSTVSGGGYFGSFLGAAFNRDDGNADKVEDELKDNHSWSVCWLRENGRFLSPNGSGDNWLTAAVALRNWVALHFVILTFAFLLIGLGVLLRAYVGYLNLDASTEPAWTQVERFFWERPIGADPAPGAAAARALPADAGGVSAFLDLRFRLSPWFVLPVLPFALLMVPTAISYWFTQVIPLMAAMRGLVSVFRRSARTISALEFARRAQTFLTRGFMIGLMLTTCCLLYALIDTVGQNVYARWAENDFAFPALWAGLTGTGFALYGFAARLVVYLESLLGRKRVRLTFDMIALGLALLWITLILCGLSVLAYGFAWRWQDISHASGYPEMTGAKPLMIAVGVTFVLSWILSRSFGFVNLSSMQQMYAARLARAYLGATNPNRRQHENHNMTELIPGDEVPLARYAPHRHGGPLHLINVTVNETISGRTQIERRDRKGLLMSLGPCGLSVGTDAHALWVAREAKGSEASAAVNALADRQEREIEPITGPVQASTPHALESRVPWGGAIVSRRPKNHPRIEALSIGRWVAISGAAFTTGTGAQTTLGLSLLLGLANVRLGYWWNSGIPPYRSPDVRPNVIELLSRAINWLLPVQSCLTNEFFARFHGPSRRHWYLSDGGHFENTGCYELIRRRVPLIICSDAGQDAKYQFEDLANLVRKARTDFGAEIQIVCRGGEGTKDDPGVEFPMPTLEQVVHPELRDVIGSPEDFTSLADAAEAETPQPPPASRRHALLARIHYLDTNTFSWLLMIKPSLMGDEAIDVIQYQQTHPLFPQEPTSDQYFDEAQWESYRKLGEHIGIELFTPPTNPVVAAGGAWSPSDLRPPEVSRAAPAEPPARPVAARTSVPGETPGIPDWNVDILGTLPGRTPRPTPPQL